MDNGIIIIFIIFAAITIWKWIGHRTSLEKEALKIPKTDPQKDQEIKTLRERVENLENLICRLDTEINQQLERSATVIGASAASNIANSEVPTTFMNVAGALESRYQVLKELGRGGMGIVFQAHDKQLNEQVAIKILSPLLSNNNEALERLKREVSAARRVTHPNVIRIHDISEMNGLHFVSMEFFQGQNLKDLLVQHGAQSLMQGFNIASQICDGLEAAHRQGVIHRDLKSQNIIINASNQIKIIDFGLAHTAQLQGLTATGLIMGTPEYMAPEQVAGKRVDERADIYALGIILYELFTGKVPFTGDSAIAIGFKQMKEEPAPAQQVNPAILPELSAVIMKTLQKDPNMRFRTVAELKQELEKAVLHPADTSSSKTAKPELQKVRQ